jgi:hypothetical protein
LLCEAVIYHPGAFAPDVLAVIEARVAADSSGLEIVLELTYSQ